MRLYSVLIETLTLPFNGWPTVFKPPPIPTLPLPLRYRLIVFFAHLASLGGSGNAPALFSKARKVGFYDLVFGHILIGFL